LSQVAFGKITTNVIAGEFIDVGVFPVDHPAALALGSRPLEEETAFNFSGGVAVTPVNNLTFTADYFYIKIKNQILLGATFDDDATLAILSAAGFGTIQGVQYFTNGLDTRTQGLDLTGNLRVPAGPSGTLDLTASFNYTRNRIIDVDPLPQVLVDAGSTEAGLLDSAAVIGIEDERPDWRGTLQANYTVGRVSGLGRLSYFGGFSSAQPGLCDLCRETYGGKGLFDAELGYQFNSIKLSVGARNLFDTYPDQPSSTVVVDTDGSTAKDFNDNFGTFIWAAASPFGYNGRFVYARTEIQLAW
jgi:iron complex outermembrane receptor protein